MKRIIAILLMTSIVTVFGIRFASAQPSDKYDGDCTGQETVGRCADKPVVPVPAPNPPVSQVEPPINQPTFEPFKGK